MNKKLLGIILIIISSLVALAIIYFVFFYRPRPAALPEVVNPISTSTPTTTSIPLQPVIPLPKPKDTTPPAASELSEESARQLALSFAELYGSYSNQSDTSRLQDLQFSVTPDYFRRLSQASRTINDNYNIYNGHQTRAIASQMLILEDSRAVLMVTTLRSTMQADNASANSTQDLKVELVKQGRVWRVANAVWQ
jgi:hypothetical protein